ncbi:hypothetical protein Hanom_Chr11g01038431 [Helianthus anomalus]
MTRDQPPPLYPPTSAGKHDHLRRNQPPDTTTLPTHSSWQTRPPPPQPATRLHHFTRPLRSKPATRRHHYTHPLQPANTTTSAAMYTAHHRSSPSHPPTTKLSNTFVFPDLSCCKEECGCCLVSDVNK